MKNFKRILLFVLISTISLVLILSILKEGLKQSGLNSNESLYLLIGIVALATIYEVNTTKDLVISLEREKRLKEIKVLRKNN